MKPECLSAEIEFKVDFNDCDPMRIVWHGNYINYFERARCALLDKIGYNYIAMEESGYLFPVTEVKCKYMRSLRFGDFCRAKAILVEYENMIKIDFELYNAKNGELTTKGSVSQMCVNAVTGETQFVCPKIWTEKVEKFLAQGGFN
ncbi:MAG: acyl-CoA thioesterase [Treponema sp.]|uniref:acyl-CoA thioesterase n=1 Tax=Treponema sp. TaxID=166 RepID=UPI001B0BECAB|nr:acyl-CoA thioesterase [Treponema sp.]MBO6218406.1 acyl-CoA thioesterase [Treponema sp.]MBQ8680269.1 acyl-CoA thioesterase [Treponema sp.]